MSTDIDIIHPSKLVVLGIFSYSSLCLFDTQLDRVDTFITPDCLLHVQYHHFVILFGRLRAVLKFVRAGNAVRVILLVLSVFFVLPLFYPSCFC